MASNSDDDAPATTRDAMPEGGLAAHFVYVVEITYREPAYAVHSGTHKPYYGRFVVRAADERAAIAQAKAEFESIAAQSGVGWVRIIEHIDCRHANEMDQAGE